jgi:hypothetical protein
MVNPSLRSVIFCHLREPKRTREFSARGLAVDVCGPRADLARPSPGERPGAVDRSQGPAHRLHRPGAAGTKAPARLQDPRGRAGRATRRPVRALQPGRDRRRAAGLVDRAGPSPAQPARIGPDRFQWRVASGEKEPTSSGASTRGSTATSPCASSPSWPRNAVTAPRPGGSGGWSSTRARAMPRPYPAGKRRSESSCFPPTVGDPVRSAAVRQVPLDAAGPAPKMKRACFDHRLPLAASRWVSGLESTRCHEFGGRERRSFRVFRFWWRNRQFRVDVNQAPSRDKSGQ